MSQSDWWAKHYSTLRRDAARIVRGAAAMSSTEFVHAAYVKLRSRVVHQPKPTAYARASIRNEVIQEWRGGRRFEGMKESVEPAKGIDPSQELDAGERSAHLERALRRLREEDAVLADVFGQRFHDGRKFVEIGRRMGTSERTARERYKRARRRLGELLDDYGPESGATR